MHSGRRRILFFFAFLSIIALLFLMVQHLPGNKSRTSPSARTLIPYQGRFLEDPSYLRLSGNLWNLVRESSRRVESALDLPLDISRIRLKLIDDTSPLVRTGNFVSRTLQGSSGSPSVIELRLEPILSGRADPRTLLTHEMAHALLAAYLGSDYRKIPVWLREGIAVHVAGETRMKLDRTISTTPFRPVTRLADGLSDHRHSTRDYAEDGLAIETLESLMGEDPLPPLARCLVGRNNWSHCLREMTGLTPEAFKARAFSDAKKRIARRAGNRPERYDRALGLLNGGNPFEALREFDQLLSEGPGPFDLEALYQGARALVVLGRPEEARIRIGKLLKRGGYGPRLAVKSLLLEAQAGRLAGLADAESPCLTLEHFYSQEAGPDLTACRTGAA